MMKITLSVITAMLLAGTCSGGDEDIPLEYRIQQGASFYLSFNNETPVAERATGDNKPGKTPKDISYDTGIKGKALKTGDKYAPLSFNVKDNLNFERAGSVSMWIKPLKWKYPKDMPVQKNGHRQRLFQGFFLTNYQKNGYMGFQRMSSYKVGGKDSLSFWIGGFKGINGGGGKDIVWPDGQWHNVVMTWDPLQFTIYIDGEEEIHCTIQRKLMNNEVSSKFSVSCPDNTMIDEFIIYNRLLNAKEVMEYYQFLKPKEAEEK
jgi:hypothetical protein